MKFVFVIILLLHGVIHLLGFIKGFGIKEVKELTLPVSQPAGIVWLITSILFLNYGLLFAVNYKYNWIIGISAVILSQCLIVLFWKDARFGTLPNMLILLISITSMNYYLFEKKVHEETQHLLNQNKNIHDSLIDENRIQNLPASVQHWLRNAGVVGRPYISFGIVSQKAEMKLKPNQKNWMEATAIQYTTIEKPAFIWTVAVKMNPLLRFQGRDKFENGRGEMLIKLNALFNIVNDQGPKLDEGSLQRFLGEMVWFPSMALSPYIKWEPLGENTAKATMTFQETVGSGIFYFNPNGEVTKFTALRYKGNDPRSKKHEWMMNITDYKTFDGIKVPSKMTSTWKLEEGDWTWLKLEVTDIKYNNARN